MMVLKQCTAWQITHKRLSMQDHDTLEGRLKQRVPGGMYNDFLGAEHADSAPRRKYRRQDSNRRVVCIIVSAASRSSPILGAVHVAMFRSLTLTSRCILRRIGYERPMKILA